jgi:hypothetical protein
MPAQITKLLSQSAVIQYAATCASAKVTSRYVISCQHLVLEVLVLLTVTVLSKSLSTNAFRIELIMR